MKPLKKFINENWFKLGIVSSLFIIVVIIFINTNDAKNELQKQDLVLKCEQIYKLKGPDVEAVRYNGYTKSNLIYSSKVKACLGYYNIPSQLSSKSLFEVWDYTNGDLVLSYQSEISNKCKTNGIDMYLSSLLFKYDKTLENSGCNDDLQEQGIDLLTNFEEAMIWLGFKK